MSSAKDLSILSYKELQALAQQHRVPGNIKKLLLIKILHAIKCGNSSEVTRLLTDLKKNRKKRTKRLKTMNSNENGAVQMVRHDSPDRSTQSDNYLFPMQQQQSQQQYPFEWVGAEEEVGTSKCEMIKYTFDYDEIRQLMLYPAQLLNNSSVIDEIVDLRTDPTITSNYKSSLEASQLDSDTSLSLLLKKMLQAPVGANLSEIASPVPVPNQSLTENAKPSLNCPTPRRIERPQLDMSGEYVYRLFRNDQPATPDTSETMSAKSDIDEDLELWSEDMPVDKILAKQNCNMNAVYRHVNTSSYYRTPPDNNGQPTSLGFEHQQQQTPNHYQFNMAPSAEVQENCRNWLASNPLDIANPVDYGTPSTSRLTSAAPLQYQNHDGMDMLNPSPGGSANVVQPGVQYCVNNDQLYPNQTSGILEPNEIVPELSFDPSRFYQPLPNLDRPQEPQDYYRQICAAAADPPAFSPDLYDSHQQQQQQQQPNEQSQHSRYSDYTQQLTNTPMYQIEFKNVAYDSPGYYQEQQQQQQQQTGVSSQSVEVATAPVEADPLQQVQDQQYENYVAQPGASTAQNNPPPAYGTAALDPYWPHWSQNDKDTVSARTGGRSLENTLNLCTPNYVDYSKLNETSCVYSNKTPVMTLRKGLNSVPSAPESRSSVAGPNNVENRQHSFASKWLLYNEDTSTSANAKRRRSDGSEASDNVENQQDCFIPNWLFCGDEASKDAKKRKLSTSSTNFEGYKSNNII